MSLPIVMTNLLQMKVIDTDDHVRTCEDEECLRSLGFTNINSSERAKLVITSNTDQSIHRADIVINTSMIARHRVYIAYHAGITNWLFPITSSLIRDDRLHQVLLYEGKDLDLYLSNLSFNVKTLTIICPNVEYSAKLPSINRVRYVLPFNKRGSCGIVTSTRVVFNSGKELWFKYPAVKAFRTKMIVYEHGMKIRMGMRLMVDLVHLVSLIGLNQAKIIFSEMMRKCSCIRFNSLRMINVNQQAIYAVYMGIHPAKLHQYLGNMI